VSCIKDDGNIWSPEMPYKGLFAASVFLDYKPKYICSIDWLKEKISNKVETAISTRLSFSTYLVQKKLQMKI
jgi:hypothetical protein